jgi:DNA-binding response OmpR family regulator
VVTATDKLCIMVVEDNVPIMEVIRQFFEIEGMETVGAAQADLALRLARSITPHLVLIDIMLDGPSGIEVARALRDGGLDKVPMIAMSASPAMLDYARASGMFDSYLPKPFDFDDLLAVTARLLDEAR